MRSASITVLAAIIFTIIASPAWAQLGWFTETLDPDVGEAGEYYAAVTTITPGYMGIPWMSYVDGPYDGERFHLKTVHLSDADEWIISTVDTNTWGYASMVIQDEWYPHLCYRRGYDYGQAVLMHAYRNLSYNWVIDTVDAAPGVEDPVIQLNAANDPVIVYGSGTLLYEKNLKMAVWTGAEWEIEVVDSAGRCEQISFVFDSEGNPHISYVLNSAFTDSCYLKYTHWNGERWEDEVLADILSGCSTSLVLDSQDHPHIAYHYASEGIFYTYNTTGEWETEQVNDEYCKYARLGLNENEQPFIAYYHHSIKALMFSMRSNGQWITQVVDDDPSPDISIGWFPDIMTNYWGDVCISYYYHESGQPCQLKYAAGYLQGVFINMTPLNLPIIIPAGGGSFEFNLLVGNLGLTTETVDIWTNAVLPPGWDFGPFVYIEDLVVPPGWSGNADRIQEVPSRAPAGLYTYRAFIGDFGSSIISMDLFQFEKLADYDPEGNFFSGWNNRGEDFESMDEPDEILNSQFSIHNSQFIILNGFPNPFNPSTTISFQLPVAGSLKISVFDVTGRAVGAQNFVPMQQWYPAGTHEVTFDGEDLSSGVYFVRLELHSAGTLQHTSVKKMLLVK